MLKHDLTEAYTDEEACPPEWVDILTHVRAFTSSLRDAVADEVKRFVREPDIRRALSRRERFSTETRKRVEEMNVRIRRLNLIAPNPRFNRSTIDASAELAPLYRVPRRGTQNEPGPT